MDYRLILAPRAKQDLKRIIQYISCDDPKIAKNFGEILIKKAEVLKTHPEIGRVVPEIKDSKIREIVVKNYRIIYRVISFERQIEILRYWHAARGVPTWS